MSSTKRTPESRRSVKSLPGVAEAAEAAEAADAAGEAAQAAEAAAAVSPGDVAASARRERFPTTSTDANRDGRALLDPAMSVLSAAVPCDADRAEVLVGAANGVRVSG
jgi:hypothetical protein